MSKIVIVEGAKNVGKTYMISNSQIPSYKFPFAGYFNKFLKDNTDNVGTGDKSTYHFSTAFDVSILSMLKQNLVASPILLIDRGFLSNIVLGNVQGRITDEDAKAYLRYLHEEGFLSDNVKVVYIVKGGDGGRDVPKDQWEYLDADDVHLKYMEYIDYLRVELGFKVDVLENNFDDESLLRFNYMCLTGILP